MTLPRTLLLCFSAVLLSCPLSAATHESGNHFHVATTGLDSNPGSESAPFQTISKAAETAQPGDTVMVHGGTYRESITPQRGGTGEDQRITYRAAPGEKVFIKGSERITNWVKEDGGVWKVTLPNSYFGEYNPYAVNTDGSCLQYGAWHHCGDVYLNGVAYYEKRTLKEVTQVAKRWFCETDEQSTTIWANFGGSNPNKELTEINVRETLFWPAKVGINYITVSGFQFSQAAPNWAGHMEFPQMAAVGPMMGKGWIIENCTLTHSRNVGIGIGWAPEGKVSEIDTFGDHIIRNNIIRKCGQAGINGKKGNSRCVISGNLIEDTNYRREFGGDETAAIKLMHSVDTIIRDNLIRNVDRQDDRAAFGIWIDYSNQGLRISRNIIYGTATNALFLEMNHGPILVDNNILIGPNGIGNVSASTIFAHNLFANCGISYSDDTRRSAYSIPHTTIQPEKVPMILRNDKLFNNIFIQRGFGHIDARPGFECDYNAFVQGAKKSSFGDKNSLESDFDAHFRTDEHPIGVTVSFLANDTIAAIQGPLVNSELVGKFELANQTLADRHGNPITVDSDFNGCPFSPVKAGPLANLEAGLNTIEWSYSTDRK